MYSAAGMGIAGTGMRDTLIEGLRILKRNDRPMSLCADGVHLTDAQVRFTFLRFDASIPSCFDCV